MSNRYRIVERDNIFVSERFVSGHPDDMWVPIGTGKTTVELCENLIMKFHDSLKPKVIKEFELE